jgi:hypothetical protein
MPRGLALARSVELRAFAWQLLRDRDRYCTDGPGTAEKNRGLFSLEKYKQQMTGSIETRANWLAFCNLPPAKRIEISEWK